MHTYTAMYFVSGVYRNSLQKNLCMDSLGPFSRLSALEGVSISPAIATNVHRESFVEGKRWETNGERRIRNGWDNEKNIYQRSWDQITTSNYGVLNL